jgi:hypothetical protein
MRTEPQGRKAILITDVKHSPQKRRNDGMPVGYLKQIALRREQCGV